MKATAACPRPDCRGSIVVFRDDGPRCTLCNHSPTPIRAFEEPVRLPGPRRYRGMPKWD